MNHRMNKGVVMPTYVMVHTIAFTAEFEANSYEEATKIGNALSVSRDKRYDKNYVMLI